MLIQDYIEFVYDEDIQTRLRNGSISAYADRMKKINSNQNKMVEVYTFYMQDEKLVITTSHDDNLNYFSKHLLENNILKNLDFKDVDLLNINSKFIKTIPVKITADSSYENVEDVIEYIQGLANQEFNDEGKSTVPIIVLDDYKFGMQSSTIVPSAFGKDFNLSIPVYNEETAYGDNSDIEQNDVRVSSFFEGFVSSSGKSIEDINKKLEIQIPEDNNISAQNSDYSVDRILSENTIFTKIDMEPGVLSIPNMYESDDIADFADDMSNDMNDMMDSFKSSPMGDIIQDSPLSGFTSNLPFLSDDEEEDDSDDNDQITENEDGSNESDDDTSDDGSGDSDDNDEIASDDDDNSSDDDSDDGSGDDDDEFEDDSLGESDDDDGSGDDDEESSDDDSAESDDDDGSGDSDDDSDNTSGWGR